MRNHPFNNHHVTEGNNYYVVNVRNVLTIISYITLTSDDYSLGILFDDFLSNYD